MVLAPVLPRRMLAPLAVIACLAFGAFAGCPKRVDLAAKLDAQLSEADAAWRKRGQLGFDAAAGPLLAAYASSPDDPQVIWRVARWRVAEGMAAVDRGQARASYAEARAVAAACLDDEPGFTQRQAAEGWAKALADLSPARRVCAAWTAFAWIRWVEVHGADAAAMDFAPIDALVAAAELDGDLAVRSVADWAGGLSLSIRPDWAGRDVARAQASFERATTLIPDSAVLRADLWRCLAADPTVSGPQRSAVGDEAVRLGRAPGAGPEDKRAADAVAMELTGGG